MAKRYHVGGAQKVAQVDGVTIGGTISTETFQILVGGVVIATYTASGGDTAQVVSDALVTAWNLSTHPYATGITASSGTAVVVLTADIIGVPFTVTATASGAATAVVAITTANAGPNVLDLATNWDGGTLPAAADDLYLANHAISVCWGLEGLTDVYGDVVFAESWTGRMGLDYQRFALDAAATSYEVTAPVPEYRPTRLKIKCAKMLIGEKIGPSLNVGGSARVDVDLQTTQAEVHVIRTAATSADVNRAAVRIAANHVGTDVFVREGVVAGVVIGGDVPGEGSNVTIRNVYVSGVTATRVQIGEGVTYTDFTQLGGVNDVAAGTTGELKCRGGTLNVDGEFAITKMTAIDGGTINSNNVPAAGAAVATCNIDPGGIVETRKNGRARTFTTVNVRKGSKLGQDPDVLTMTNFNLMDSGQIAFD